MFRLESCWDQVCFYTMILLTETPRRRLITQIFVNCFIVNESNPAILNQESHSSKSCEQLHFVV